MKKIMLIIPVLALSIFVRAQQLRASIKLVSGKARIAVMPVGGSFTSVFPSNFVFVVSIPAANGGDLGAAGAVLGIPTKIDANMVPTSLALITGALPTYTDPAGPGTRYTYFLLFYTSAGSTATTFTNNTEYDILELPFTGTLTQSFPVSVMSLPDGNPGASVAPGQWQHYLEIGGGEASAPPSSWFYQSGTSLAPTQAADYSTGTAVVTTNANITVLPVNMLNFSGYKNGNKNSLLWTTGTEENNRGFDVQRSVDGVNYSSIGFVGTQAVGGNSTSALNYGFNDNSPVGKKQYYRLRQEDFDGRSKLSNIVLIKGDKPTTLDIGGLFPNPARSLVNVIIDAPGKDNVTLIVTDMTGKTVKQQVASVDIGSNTVPVDIANLASGSYLVKVLCKTSDCEAAVGKFNKQ